MSVLLHLLAKEFRQIFRDRIILAMMMVMPAGQLIVLPLAANFEVRNINVCVVDHDHSTASRRLTESISRSSYFTLVDVVPSMRSAMNMMAANTIDVALEIPHDFDRRMVRGESPRIVLAANAINGMKANIGTVYLGHVLQRFSDEQYIAASADGLQRRGIEIRTIDRFNPALNYRTYMVPGILALLLTMIAVYLSALNIVREQEIGTIEQINVTPITKVQFIAGKLIPFWILGLVVFSIGMLLARVVYGVIPQGSIVTIYLFAGVYLITVLGLGLLISTISRTQQQAMFMSFFFMMIFIMMGGLFTSIDSMPAWAQTITILNPVRYFIDVMRMVVLKGSTLYDIRHHLLVIAVMGVVLNGVAVLNYRKTN
ncbi:MAG: ABC transporter permease [Candidatus Kapabacteria bacterium]|nr:ABC transporter permease [Candidatus Kapabacteria bacterium]